MNKERGLYNTTKVVANALNICKLYNERVIWADKYLRTLEIINEQWRYGLLTYREYNLLFKATSKTFEKYIKQFLL